MFGEPFEELLDAKAGPLWGKFGSAREDPCDAAFAKRRAFFGQAHGEGFQEFRGGEHALDVVVGRKDRDGLVDAVLLVLFEMFHPPLLDELDHPSRIQVDAKADAAPVLAQVLDG